MRKRKQYLWEVSRLGGSSAKFIGSGLCRESGACGSHQAIENPAGGSVAAVGSAGVSRFGCAECTAATRPEK
jgi:hypothetical protein